MNHLVLKIDHRWYLNHQEVSQMPVAFELERNES